MEFSPEYVGKAFSPKRLGGICYFNFCADGETLLQKNIEKYIFEIVKQGHYIEIVTNLTVTSVIDKILTWDKEVLKRIEFKCSFHYIELKKKNLLDKFALNVKNIWKSGASANIEITPSDEYIEYIDEIIDFSKKNFGALPQLSIARNDATDKIEYLTSLSDKEYDKVWSQFDSDFWKFKRTIFGKKRNEYCYAGRWSLFVNMQNGDTTQCYCTRYSQNIFEDLSKEINFVPIGKCKEPHCYNGHMLLTLGLIPELNTPYYGDIRNRIKDDGKEWLQSDLKKFFNSKLVESNQLLTRKEKAKYKFICIGKSIYNKIKSL